MQTGLKCITCWCSFCWGGRADGAFVCAHCVNVTLNFKDTNTRENTLIIPYFPRHPYLPYFSADTIHAECTLITSTFSPAWSLSVNDANMWTNKRLQAISNQLHHGHKGTVSKYEQVYFFPWTMSTFRNIGTTWVVNDITGKSATVCSSIVRVSEG